MLDINEAKTRKALIDPALKKAGWDVGNSAQVGIEIPVDGFDQEAWKKLEAQIRAAEKTPGVQLPKGISDYALYRENGEIIAIVEAKRSSFDPRLAQAQTEFYVKEIEKIQGWRPFAFMTNGYEIYFLDIGVANKRLVAGFFSALDLENLLYLRNNKTPLTQAPINTSIAGRPYQQEGIRRICEAFELGKRRALLVMATGTGKTRTSMAIVDIFLRTNQARRILFVADRDALVKQALDDGFSAFIPDEPCARIHSYDIDKSRRLYVSTLQTLSGCFEEFTPAFFDLIIFDEVHRSIFNKWNEVLEYFDGRIIGLTATPAAFIDRNTFLQFECPDNIPTFLYPYEQAIDEGHLVDFDLWKGQTHFQRKGIRGVDLSEEERNILIEQGLDPDALDFSGTDLEDKISNTDTLRRQWEEVWDKSLKDESGQLPGKTIVFAWTQDHAQRLLDVFEKMYPQHPGLAKVITSKSEYKGTLVKEFKKENLPRIAISVDMLETGVDVPEAVNLIFMRPVQSGIKLWQMIGRGTRNNEACRYFDRLPNGRKDKFLIIDFWENDFKKAPSEGSNDSLPVLLVLFNTRLNLMELLINEQQSADVQRLIADLRKLVAQIPTDSFSVKKFLPDIEHVWDGAFWSYITKDKIKFLMNKVGPLLKYASCGDVQAVTFTGKVERFKLQTLKGANTAETAKSIAEDASRLPDFVREDTQCEQAIALCCSPKLKIATMAELNQVIDVLADKMKYRRKAEDAFITVDLLDYIDGGGFIILFGGKESVYVKDYRERIEQRILDLLAGNPVIEAIEHGKPVDDSQLLDLERALRRELCKQGMELSQDNIRKTYGFKAGSLLEFVRRLLEIDGLPDYEDIVRRQFETFISAHTFNGDQIRFLRAVQSVFLQKRKLAIQDLYTAPLTSFGQNAVERLFNDNQIKEILNLTNSLVVNGGWSAN